MVHLVCVINVSRAFTYPPTLMIANVLFSVLLRRVWIPLPFFFYLSLFPFLPLLLPFLSTARSSSASAIQKRGTRRMRVRIISRNVGFS